jgi:hypothetical protein
MFYPVYVLFVNVEGISYMAWEDGRYLNQAPISKPLQLVFVGRQCCRLWKGEISWEVSCLTVLASPRYNNMTY